MWFTMGMAANPDLIKAMRAAERERRVQALREGRVQRAVTFTDRRKQASRNACRGRVIL